MTSCNDILNSKILDYCIGDSLFLTGELSNQVQRLATVFSYKSVIVKQITLFNGNNPRLTQRY